MKLRWAGSDRIMYGNTALECLRFHLHSSHSAEAQSGDVDGEINRIANTFLVDPTYRTMPTLETRCEAFVKTAREIGLIVDATVLRWPRCVACTGCTWSCREAPCGDPGDENDGDADAHSVEEYMRRGRSQ